MKTHRSHFFISVNGQLYQNSQTLHSDCPDEGQTLLMGYSHSHTAGAACLPGYLAFSDLERLAEAGAAG